MHITDMDLVGLLETDTGIALYSSFVEASLSQTEIPDEDTAKLWACWQDIKEYKDMEDEGDCSNDAMMKEKVQMIMVSYLTEDAPQKLPSECDEVKKDVIEQIEKGVPVEIN